MICYRQIFQSLILLLHVLIGNFLCRTYVIFYSFIHNLFKKTLSLRQFLRLHFVTSQQFLIDCLKLKQSYFCQKLNIIHSKFPTQIHSFNFKFISSQKPPKQYFCLFSRMNVDIDKYVRNFRIFYSKAVSGHPEHVALQKKFKLLLENQASKWRSGLLASSKEESVTSAKYYLSKARSQQAKSQSNAKKHDWMMETNNFSRTYIFVCILSLLEVKSKQGIQMIRAHLQNEGALQEGKMFYGATLRKIIYGWSKIEKLFANIVNSKPHILLSDCFNQFPDEFINALYDILTDKRVAKIGVGDVTYDNLNTLSDSIRVSLTFFEFENNKVQNVKKCGSFKRQLCIGYLVDEQTYVVASQLPKKHKDDAEGKTLVNLSKISNELFQMYADSDVKIRNLQCVKATSQSKNSQLFGFQSSSIAQNSLKRKESISSMSLSRI